MVFTILHCNTMSSQGILLNPVKKYYQINILFLKILTEIQTMKSELHFIVLRVYVSNDDSNNDCHYCC